MTKRSATKDELFLLKLYHMTERQKDPAHEHDPEYVASLIGISPKSAKNMVNTLAQANFIKKLAEGKIALTANGKKLASELEKEIG